MKRKCTVQKVLRAVSRFLVIFLLIAFVTTCCTSLFVTTLSESLNISWTQENITAAAKITFLNVILLSVLLTVIDSIRRKLTVERPVTEIIRAAEKIVRGDFSVRIKPRRGYPKDDPFNRVISCFNQMARELNSVETLRSDFIANVSHEMKTPLAVMQNYGTLLQREDLTPEQRLEYARGVTDGARRMADMMTNILKLNRLENQQIYPKAAEFDLGEQLRQCLLQYETVWEKENIEIETDIEEEVTVKADGELLSHVWSNLLSNAFKFTDPGGKVFVGLTATERHATVRVTDTGCGMSQEVGAHIFEKFYQGDVSRATQGNGLGLALVKRVVDILHGEISVESVVGAGTTFIVKIPKNERK